MDAYRWHEEQRANRSKNLALAKANRESMAPDPEPTPTRSFGFQSGAARGLAEGRTADLVRAGTELGAPTSYAGGAGAPESIGVIRGMKQTYAQDTGGPQLQEFATPQQAGQAWNRRQLQLGASPTGTPEEVRPGGFGGEVKPGTPGVGGYDPAEGPKIRETGLATEGVERAKAEVYNKQPQLQAAADVINSDQAAKLYGERLKSVYGEEVKDEKGNTRYVLPPSVAHAASGHTPRTPQEVDAAMEKAKPAIEAAKAINLFTDPAKSDPARASILKQYRNERAASGQPIDPAVEKYITTAPVGTHNLEWFKGAYQRALPKPGAAPSMVPVAGTPSETGFVPSAIDNLTLLGKQLGYEMSGGAYGEQKRGLPVTKPPSLADVTRERVRNRENIFNPPPRAM